jgi:AcrR family transcriptional regulator
MSRDRQILESAAEAFYEKGFHGVGVDELGVRAGLSGPSLYRHFSGKDEILATLLNEAMDELMSATLTLHGAPSEDLDRAIAHHIQFAIRHRHLVSLYQREVGALVDPWRKAFTRRRAQYSEKWEGLFRARYPSLDKATAATVSQACLGTIFSVALWPGRTAHEPHVPELLSQLLHEGFASLT